MLAGIGLIEILVPSYPRGADEIDILERTTWLQLVLAGCREDDIVIGFGSMYMGIGTDTFGTAV